VLRERVRAHGAPGATAGKYRACTLAVGLQARPSALEFLEADCVWKNVSSRIYGQQADPVIGYCPALTRLPHNLDLGVRAHVYVYGAHVYGAHVLVLAVVVLKPGLIWLW
jgi:hypothetical protein